MGICIGRPRLRRLRLHSRNRQSRANEGVEGTRSAAVWSAALFLLLLVAGLVCGCATPSPAPMVHGLPNFAQVCPGVYRGGQPANEGWDYLYGVGVSKRHQAGHNGGGERLGGAASAA